MGLTASPSLPTGFYTSRKCQKHHKCRSRHPSLRRPNDPLSLRNASLSAAANPFCSRNGPLRAANDSLSGRNAALSCRNNPLCRHNDPLPARNDLAPTDTSGGKDECRWEMGDGRWQNPRLPQVRRQNEECRNFHIRANP